MDKQEFQVQISKNGSLVVVDPKSKSTLTTVPFSGQIMKGCSGGNLMQVMDLLDPNKSRTMRQFETQFSFGHFSSSAVPGVISMQQNPKFPDSGYEIEVFPGQAFPKKQYWSMFGIFTIDLSGLNPAFSRFQVANREESPIRLSLELQRPWGDESLRYEMIDTEVPLYPWDATIFNFASVCPLTGGQACPIAFIKKDTDETFMTAAWRRVNGTLIQTT